MYKIAVIGTVDTVKCYRALGLETYSVESDEQARRIMVSLIRPDEKYGIIYLEETFADGLQAEIKKAMSLITTTVCLIPGRSGALGMGIEAIQSSVERAIGADIL